MPNQPAFKFVDLDWTDQPLYDLPAGINFHCPEHGDFDLHAYFDDMEISEMVAEGYLECPECLVDIVGICN